MVRFVLKVPDDILSSDISKVDGIPLRACQLWYTQIGIEYPRCWRDQTTPELQYIDNSNIDKDNSTGDVLSSVNTCCLTKERQCPPGVDPNPYAEEVDFWVTVYRVERKACNLPFAADSFYSLYGFETHSNDEYPFACLSCKRIDASVRKCPDGTYATDYLDIDASDVLLNVVTCVPCNPGTFNSCQQGDSCVWNIPRKGDSMVTTTINSIFAFQNSVPVKQCYPCASAAGRSTMNHYASLTNQLTPKMSTIPVIDEVKISMNGRERYRFFCPGNLDGNDGVPRMCGDNYIAKIDMSACVCMEGKYEVIVGGAPRCVDCPAGSYCTDGVKRDCPDDFYQSITGQASCNDCRTLDMCATGFRRRKCVAGNKHEIPPCIKCDQCRHIYSDDKNDRAECYRI